MLPHPQGIKGSMHNSLNKRLFIWSRFASISNASRFTFRQMDNNFSEFLTGGWNTPTHILERRLILSVVKVLCTRYTHSLHPHRTHKVENSGVGSIKRLGGGGGGTGF